MALRTFFCDCTVALILSIPSLAEAYHVMTGVHRYSGNFNVVDL